MLNNLAEQNILFDEYLLAYDFLIVTLGDTKEINYSFKNIKSLHIESKNKSLFINEILISKSILFEPENSYICTHAHAKNVALKHRDIIKKILCGVQKKIFLVARASDTDAGMVSIIAKIISELNKTTIPILIKPYKFQGKKNARIAEDIFIELNKYNNKTIVFNSDGHLPTVNKKANLKETFSLANRNILSLIKNNIINNKNDYINIDNLQFYGKTFSFEKCNKENYKLYRLWDKITIEVAEKILGNDFVQLSRQILNSDEIFHFSTSNKSWANLAGTEGVALVRDGIIVSKYETIIS